MLNLNPKTLEARSESRKVNNRAIFVLGSLIWYE